jgi:hypothetical protein
MREVNQTMRCKYAMQYWQANHYNLLFHQWHNYEKADSSQIFPKIKGISHFQAWNNGWKWERPAELVNDSWTRRKETTFVSVVSRRKDTNTNRYFPWFIIIRRPSKLSFTLFFLVGLIPY